MATLSRAQNGTVDSWVHSGGPSAKRKKLKTPMFPCLVCKEQFRRRGDLWEHLTSKENGVNVFVCMACHRGFCKERLLRTHSCGNVQSAYDDHSTALSVFCHIVACEECGVFVALVNQENPSWKSYSSLCVHPSRSFRKITLYTWTPETIHFIKSDLSIPFNFRVDFGPAVSKGVPLSCNVCGHRYASLDEVEKHVSEKHRDRYPMVQCQYCSSKFSSSLRMDLHMAERHDGRDRWALLDFLKCVPVVEPYLEKTAVGRTDSYVFCDLCQLNFLGNKFNEHDCVVNYMRRYLLNGKIIFCPAVNLPEFSIDMGIQDPMLVSLTETVQRRLELCLRFYIPIVAPSIGSFGSDQVYSCNHCARIVASPLLFREHVLEVAQEQSTRFQWPTADAASRKMFLHFGKAIAISESGFSCPKLGCSTTSCSPAGLELHMLSTHEDTFQALDFPATPTTDSSQNLSGERSCPMCQEKGFREQGDLQAHVRDCHLHPCAVCGSCFVNQKRLDFHKRSSACGGQSDDTQPLSYCPICKEVFQVLSDYYCHLIIQHPTEAGHDEILGAILPKCCLFLQPRNATKIDHTYNNDVETSTAKTKTEPLSEDEELLDESVVALPVVSESSEDDIEVIPNSDVRTASAPAVIDGDDEVTICEPDPGPSTGRQPTHGCGICSQKFYTLRAAEEHRQSHESDTGLTTPEVLPVPPNMPVYLCRLCCLAYQDYPGYMEHMRKHRPIVECELCLAVCLNPQYLEKHMKSHRSKMEVFGCPTCRNAFRTETALLLHLNQAHNLPLLWYCHKCGMAHSEWKGMAAHTCGESLPDVPVIIPTSKKKLHYQPCRGSDFDIPTPAEKADKVSECFHRSFLGCQETGIACLNCGTIMSASSYLSATGEDEKFRLTLVDESSERALVGAHQCSNRMRLSFDKMMAMKTEKALTPKATAQRPLLPAPPTSSGMAVVIRAKTTGPRPVPPTPTSAANAGGMLAKMVAVRPGFSSPLSASNVVTVLPKTTVIPSSRPVLPAPGSRVSNPLIRMPSATAVVRNINPVQRNFQ